MRDIREDLRERANILVGQINLAQGKFDKLIEQLKLEHDSKLHSLKSELELVQMVTRIEDRRLASAPSARRAATAAAAHATAGPVSTVAF